VWAASRSAGKQDRLGAGAGGQQRHHPELHLRAVAQTHPDGVADTAAERSRVRRGQRDGGAAQPGERARGDRDGSGLCRAVGGDALQRPAVLALRAVVRVLHEPGAGHVLRGARDTGQAPDAADQVGRQTAADRGQHNVGAEVLGVGAFGRGDLGRLHVQQGRGDPGRQHDRHGRCGHPQGLGPRVEHRYLARQPGHRPQRLQHGGHHLGDAWAEQRQPDGDHDHGWTGRAGRGRATHHRHRHDRQRDAPGQEHQCQQQPAPAEPAARHARLGERLARLRQGRAPARHQRGDQRGEQGHARRGHRRDPALAERHRRRDQAVGAELVQQPVAEVGAGQAAKVPWRAPRR
jgi:hypothetical protein